MVATKDGVKTASTTLTSSKSKQPVVHRHGKLLLASLSIRRQMGLHPYPRRRRKVAYRTPCGLLEVFNALGPAAYSRVGAMNGLTVEGAPAYGDDIGSVVATLNVIAPSRRNLVVVQEIAALLAELGDARRAAAKR